MFIGRAISSSESHAPSALSVRELGIWKLYFPFGRSRSGLDHFRCAALDVVRPKQSEDPWWRPPLGVEEGMAPPFGKTEEMTAILDMHGTYPYSESLLDSELSVK